MTDATETTPTILRDLNAEKPADMHYGLVVVIDEDDSAEVNAENAIVEWYRTEAEMYAAWTMACALGDAACSNTPAIKKMDRPYHERYVLTDGGPNEGCCIQWEAYPR